MRVLLLNQVFRPDPQSTAQHLSRAAEYLVERGFRVTVIASARAYDDSTRLFPARETWRGVEIIRVPTSGLGHATKLRRIVDYLSFLVAAGFRALSLGRFDRVVTLTTPPLLSVLGAMLGMLWNCPFIYWVMDLNPDEAVAVGWLRAEGPVHRLLEACSRWSLRRAARVLALDPYMRERIIAKGIAPEKIEVVLPWMHGDVAYDPAGRSRFRAAHGFAESDYVVMYAGNHSPCHPLDTLVAAAERLRGHARLRFCFSGGGGEWARLRALAREAGWNHATFLGYQPQAELSALLSSADTHVVVMGDPFVGIVHPCKVYNFLAVQRPFVVIGPTRSHLGDLLATAQLGPLAAAFRHGEVERLAEELRRRADEPVPPAWPEPFDLSPWGETACLEKIATVLLQPGR